MWMGGGFGGGSANAMAKQIAEDKGDLAKKNGFASTDEMAKVFFGDLAEQAKAAGLPVPIFSFGDEPPDTVAPKMIELHKRVKDAGGRCTVCWSPAGEPTHQLLDVTTVCSLNVAKIADIERAVKAGNEIYLNNQGVNRWAYGLYMWKAHQAGVKAYQQFIWMGMHADPYFPLDSIEDDLSMVYPDRDGRLRPIVNLLRIREGIDDYRYTLALTQAILKASGGDDAHKKLATEAKAYLEGVIGKIAFEDTRKDRNPQMTQAQLDDYRAKVQEFLLKLDAK